MGEDSAGAKKGRPELKPLSKRGRLVFHGALAVLGACGLLAFVFLYDDVSPMASVDFKVTRGEAFRIAKAYLEGRGYDLEGHDSAIVFSVNSHASHFLERTLGVSKANDLMRKTVPLRYWYARWFRPLQKEEFRVWVEPTGKVLAFDHLLPEDAPGESLSQEEAKKLAVRFLSDRGVDLEEYELQSPSSEKRENRTDHSFTWQKKDFDVEGGKLRLTADVHGGEVGYYDGAWLKVPEEFSRNFGKERSYAWAMWNVSHALRIALILCCCLALVWMYKHRTIRVKPVLYVAAFLAVLAAAHGLNYVPIVKGWYPTSQRMGTFFLNRFLRGLQDAFEGLFILGIMAVCGEALSREIWGRESKIIGRSRDRWVSVAASSSRGLLLGFLGLGYVVLFYFVAKGLGAWTPMMEPYTNLFGTKLPFLHPLLVGARPALAEETLFRLFAISFLLLVTKRKWVALLVPAVVWAFLHSPYLTSPTYLRGVELTIVGLWYGYIFLQFDLLTLIVAHYSYHAVVSGMPLLRSGNPYFLVSGLIVMGLMVIPIIPGAYRALKRWRKGDVEEPAVEVLPCGPADLDGHEAFWSAIANYRGALLEELREDLRRALESPGAAVLVARREEEVAGYAVGRVEAKAGTVSDIFVREELRQRSVGTELYRALSSWMKEKGAESVRVETDLKDSRAKSFWLAQGFVPSTDVLRKEIAG